MRRYGVLMAVAAAALALNPAPAHADGLGPQPGAPCPADFTDVMTRLPDVGDFLVCQASGMWAPVLGPFDPAGRWLSYGAGITLHGQGFRNPNLRSGQWTAAPLDPSAVCSADQVTVIGPGELAPVVHSPGEVGQPLHLEVLPKLFTITMNGDCLWSEDQPPGLG
ncbi:hypothetical protein [Mycolicibacterium rhodesiae]|uniref:Secreted protein n=1 Tax=Mycolicibacterium rhodesiae TaxID=36814 RepID=A0A1X0J7B2_MYCRH|nr:hypothetical protein [Mycolicibacterium rhodesiae]MCV7348287.1 hypothetical protein [Mycolicibacterium rhodesiae]ORB57377.1 hypothetical protein BST42_03090 [Mycolicibacterium rhodesiae]